MYKEFIKKVRDMKQQILELVKNININIDLLRIASPNGETNCMSNVKIYTARIQTIVHEITHVIAYALEIFDDEDTTIDIEILPTICAYKYIGIEPITDKEYYYYTWGGEKYFSENNVKYDIETLIAYADIFLLEYEDIYNLFIDRVVNEINNYIIKCNDIDKSIVRRINSKLSPFIIEKLIQKNEKIKEIIENTDVITIAKNSTKENYISATISDILYSTFSNKLLDINNNNIKEMKNIITKIFNVFPNDNEKMYKLYKLTVAITEEVFDSWAAEVTDVFEHILRYLAMMIIIAPNETDDFYINNVRKELSRIMRKQAIAEILYVPYDWR